MTREKLFLVLTEMAIQAKAIAMSQSPIRTGRMVKSIKILFHNDGFSVIVPEEIYYFKYTDELGDNPNPYVCSSLYILSALFLNNASNTKRAT